jgi:RimJ/RimL family protein N-acetyltransferase
VFGPLLRGEKISLEPPSRDDGALRLGWFADLEVTRLYTSPGVPSLQQEEESYEGSARDENLVLWRIVLDGRAIGSAFIHDIDWLNRSARTGMVIGERAEWGKGFGSEVVRLRTVYAVDELNLVRLETSSIDVNIGMHRALERSGFRRIGLRRRRYIILGVYHDEYIFELLREEWEKERESCSE